MKTTKLWPWTEKSGEIKGLFNTEEDILCLWNALHKSYLNLSYSYLGHLSRIFTWYWNTLVSDAVCGCSWCINFRADGWPYAWRSRAGPQKEKDQNAEESWDRSPRGQGETKGMAGCLCTWVYALGLTGELTQTSEQVYLTKSTWRKRQRS